MQICTRAPHRAPAKWSKQAAAIRVEQHTREHPIEEPRALHRPNGRIEPTGAPTNSSSLTTVTNSRVDDKEASSCRARWRFLSSPFGLLGLRFGPDKTLAGLSVPVGLQARGQLMRQRAGWLAVAAGDARNSRHQKSFTPDHPIRSPGLMLWLPGSALAQHARANERNCLVPFAGWLANFFPPRSQSCACQQVSP